MNRKKQKIVITGGAGFVGSNLSKKLLELGYEVHIIDNLSGGKTSNIPRGAFFHRKDIRKFNDIVPLFKNASYVFHLAALPNVEFSIRHPDISHDSNVNGTLNVLRACSEHKIKKYVFASSSSVYGDGNNKKMSESTPFAPKSPYALHKIIGEGYAKLWCNNYGLNTVSLRFFNIYGKGQRDEGPYAFVIAIFLKLKSLGLPMMITGTGEQRRDFIHINDVVSALIKAMRTKTEPGSVFNIGSGTNYSINEIATMIEGPIAYVKERTEPKSTLCDNSLAKKILGWQPSISLREGIEDLKKIRSNTHNTTKRKDYKKRLSRKAVSRI